MRDMGEVEETDGARLFGVDPLLTTGTVTGFPSAPAAPVHPRALGPSSNASN